MIDKMRALIYKGKEVLELVNVNIPELSDREVLVKVLYTGICGTDLMIYAGKHPRVQEERILGHEFIGEVVDKKGNMSNIRIGDMVIANPLISCGSCYPCKTDKSHVCQNLRLIGVDLPGGFAEYVKVNAEKVYKIPDTITNKTAALVEPLAVGIHGIRCSPLKIGDNALIIGGGPIGLMTAYAAKAAGANVLISEVNEYRISLLKSAGFETINALDGQIVKEVMKKTNNIGADIVIDCSGVQQGITDAVAACRVKGHIVITALYKDAPLTNFRDIVFKEISFCGARVYTEKDIEAAISLLEKGFINNELAISHEFPLENGKEGFEILRKGENSMKILLYP